MVRAFMEVSSEEVQLENPLVLSLVKTACYSSRSSSTV